MVWNTIAHPRMMGVVSDGGGASGTFTTYPIKFADPHKMAFFDLIVDKTDSNKLVLVHGDYETVKNKILNHEMVIAVTVRNKIRNSGTRNGVLITPMQIVPIECINKDDQYIILVDTDVILTPDNKIVWAEDTGAQ